MTTNGSTEPPAPTATSVPESANSSSPSTGRFDGKAVLAVTLGAVSVLLLLVLPLLGWLTAIPAVILGHLALRNIHTTGDRGREIAIAGLATGYVIVAIGLLLFAIGAIGTAVYNSDQQNPPDACISKTGNFTHKQLQRCFDATNH